MRASRAVVLLVVAAAVLAIACDDPPSTTPTPPVGPPQLSCPASVTVAGVAGPTAVSYTAPVEKDGTPPVTVTCSPVSGSTFVVGTTPVACSAKDNIARTAACAFNVTLTPLKLGAVKFMAFGDSLTAGENGNDGGTSDASPASPACMAQSASSFKQGGAQPLVIDLAHSYPTDLASALSLQFPTQSMSVTNEGSPGESAHEGANPPPSPSGRFQCTLGLDQPDAVLLLEGINDLLGAPPTPETWEDAINNSIVPSLSADISAAFGHGIRYVFVSSLLPITDCTLSGFHPCRGMAVYSQFVTEANGKIADAARSAGAVFVDGYGAFVARDPTIVNHPNDGQLIGADGLHATPAGYTLLAQTFQAAIVANIPQTAGARGPVLNLLSSPKRR